jgi:hypothetical protein
MPFCCAAKPKMVKQPGVGYKTTTAASSFAVLVVRDKHSAVASLVVTLVHYEKLVAAAG